MTSGIELTDEWQRWMVENLERGCSLEALMSDMVRSGFEPSFARSILLAFAEERGMVSAMEAGKKASDRPLLDRNVISTFDREVVVHMRIATPTVVLLGNVLSSDECDELIRRSKGKITRSSIIDPASGEEEVISARSSDGTYFERQADDFIATLDRRFAEITGFAIERGEGIQILRYAVGGEYRPHFDFFAPNSPGSAVHLARGGQRVASLVIYLTDTARGGTTIFPKLELEFVPRKGCAVYFEYCDIDGHLDELTLHGGSPVRDGEKWIATKWFRQNDYG